MLDCYQRVIPTCRHHFQHLPSLFGDGKDERLNWDDTPDARRFNSLDTGRVYPGNSRIDPGFSNP